MLLCVLKPSCRRICRCNLVDNCMKKRKKVAFKSHDTLWAESNRLGVIHRSNPVCEGICLSTMHELQIWSMLKHDCAYIHHAKAWFPHWKWKCHTAVCMRLVICGGPYRSAEMGWVLAALRRRRGIFYTFGESKLSCHSCNPFWRIIPFVWLLLIPCAESSKGKTTKNTRNKVHQVNHANKQIEFLKIHPWHQWERLAEQVVANNWLLGI